MILAFVLLFVIIAGLIQIPAIQTKIVHSATNLVSNKTHTIVEIKNISISFPKSIVVKGIFLEDTQHDTLVYAEKAKISVALFDLLSNKININSFSLDNANVNLYSSKTNPNFNYNFLITAFSDTTAKVDTLTASKWTFTLNKVNLNNTQFRYNNVFGGIDVSANVSNLELKIKEMDLRKLDFQINNLLVDGLFATIVRTETSDTTSTQGASTKFAVKNLEINNSSVNYTDSISQLAIVTALNQMSLEVAAIDLQKQYLAFETIYLAKSEINYNNFATADSTTTIPNSTIENGWQVSVKNIELNDNSIAYNSGNKPELKHLFDANHVKYNHVKLEANHLGYSPHQTKITVSKLSAIDQNNFAITHLETDFMMDQYSISAKKIKANTHNSLVDGDFEIKYTSLSTLIDSLQFTQLNLNLTNASISNSDLLYFNPQLSKQPFFKNSAKVTNASGKINGSMNHLSGKNVMIKMGANTQLATDFTIIGLTNYKTANYDFPKLEIKTNRHDVEMLADTLLPQSIALPENINLKIVFKGKLKAFESTADLSTSYGNAKLVASVDKTEHFSGNVSLQGFDMGQLLKDTVMYGSVSLTAEVTGHGLEQKTIEAKIKANVSEFYLNNYLYHHLALDGTFSDQKLQAKLILNDENIAFDLDALVNLAPYQGHYKFRLNLKGADLQKLHITNNDIRVGLVATADFKGDSVSNLNGKAEISNLVVYHNTKRYKLDAINVTALNEPNKSKLNLNSALVHFNYSGTKFPTSVAAEFNRFLTNYFPFTYSLSSGNQTLSDFSFEIQLHNHPILSEVLLPELHEFEPGIIQGSFNGASNNLTINATIKKIVYGTTEIKDFTFNVNSTSKALNYEAACRNITNSVVSLEHVLVNGKLADNKINTSISSVDDKKNKKLVINSQIVKENTNYKLTLDPADFYLMNEKWNLDADNYVAFGKQGFLIHHFFMSNSESQINISSINEKFKDDINIDIKNFKLDNISGVIQNDTALVKGIVDGNILLKRKNNSYGIIANAKIANLKVSNIAIGDLNLKAENTTTEKFNVEVNLSGADNKLNATGYYIPNGGNNSVYLKTTIQSLSLKTAQAFSMGTITNASGNLSGNILIEGDTKVPEITGELVFNNAIITPAMLNNPLELKHETFQIKKDGFYFNSFTMLDADKHPLTIDGVIKMNRFSNYVFALNLNTKDFLLFNTTHDDNKEFYGRMIIDSKIDVTGPLSLPVVNAKIRLKNGSNFTFAVPEDQLTTDKGADVVEFETNAKLNPILNQPDKKIVQKSRFTGYDVTSIIEIDKQATLRLLMDPTSSDSLVVRGEAALSFTIDRSGKISLTGAYNLNEGSYMASLESVIKRQFEIDRGSSIIWSGNPYDADISINATYSVRASPADLMAYQMTGLSETDRNQYKQRYPFLVLLKMRGKLLHPEISFEIQLAPEDKGILGGAVNQKLILLNEDESSLNKQVFALLVLGRFIQENPLQTEINGASSIVRTTVGKILSQQLNQWSSKVLPSVNLNFDIQSFNDYQAGLPQGRTQVDIGIKKQLFNERLSIQLGGTVDVEGEKASQNNASNITSDVTVEYKITKDGRYRLKGFRHNQYEGIIEGQLVETGVGFLYVHDFNKWKDFFRLKKEAHDSLKTKK